MDMHRRTLLVTQPPRIPGGSEVSSEIEYDDQFRYLLFQQQLDAAPDAMAETLADYLAIDYDLLGISATPDVMYCDDVFSEGEC
jgi:hypothetical protein